MCRARMWAWIDCKWGPMGCVLAPSGYALDVPSGYKNGGYGSGAGYGSLSGRYGMGSYWGVLMPPLSGGYGGGSAPPQVVGYGNAHATAPHIPWGGATMGVGGAGDNCASHGLSLYEKALVQQFFMENGAKGCEVIVSGKLRSQHAKSMEFKDVYMISFGQPINEYIDCAIGHILLRQGVLGKWDESMDLEGY